MINLESIIQSQSDSVPDDKPSNEKDSLRNESFSYNTELTKLLEKIAKATHYDLDIACQLSSEKLLLFLKENKKYLPLIIQELSESEFAKLYFFLDRWSSPSLVSKVEKIIEAIILINDQGRRKEIYHQLWLYLMGNLIDKRQFYISHRVAIGDLLHWFKQQNGKSNIHLDEAAIIRQLASDQAIDDDFDIQEVIDATRPLVYEDDVIETEPETSRDYDSVSVDNAGIVIIATYMPRLFDMFGLIKDEQFTSIQHQQKALSILDAIVSKDENEHEVHCLSNILCGLDIDFSTKKRSLTDKEQEIIEGLLSAVIQNWSALGKTSIQGLRETFIQRQGVLYWDDDKWQLTVHQETFDMLLDQLPWGFSVIKHPWMEHPIHVTWRN
nr:contractile injection system tape measure protein [Pleionea sp. CnH1-48]